MMSRMWYDSDYPNYRFGFNGKEMDHEAKGNFAQLDYGMRPNDPRIGGRFLSVDPLAQKYPELSPYAFAANSPIKFIDLDGLEPAINEKTSNNGYRRGKSGDHIASVRYISDDVIAPYIGGPVHQEYVAQASYFADAIGGTLYQEKDGYIKSVGPREIYEYQKNVYVKVPKNSEIVIQTIKVLKDVYKADLDIDMLATIITDQFFVFHPDRDYSFLFWEKTSNIKLVGVGGAIAIPRPVAVPVLPNVGVNTKSADIVVDVKALSSELAATISSIFGSFLKSQDASKSEKHGDSGRAKTKAEKQIEELLKQLEDATGKLKKQIKKKIENIRKTAEKKAKGEEHSRTGKR